MPLATYITWAGVGLVLTALVSVVFFGEKADFIGIVSIGLILLGVVLLNTMSHMSGALIPPACKLEFTVLALDFQMT